MRHGGDLVLLEHLRQPRRGYRPAAPHRKHEPVAVAESSRRVEVLQRPAAERDPVLTLRLHRRRREHQEFERQPDDGLRRSRASDRLNGCGHVLVGQRLPVRHDVVLRAAAKPRAGSAVE